MLLTSHKKGRSKQRVEVGLTKMSLKVEHFKKSHYRKYVSIHKLPICATSEWQKLDSPYAFFACWRIAFWQRTTSEKPLDGSQETLAERPWIFSRIVFDCWWRKTGSAHRAPRKRRFTKSWRAKNKRVTNGYETNRIDLRFITASVM